MCSHATVTDSDFLSLFWDSNLGLILAWMFNTSELDEFFRILNSIKGFKLRQPHRSNTTIQKPQIGNVHLLAGCQVIGQVKKIGKLDTATPKNRTKIGFFSRKFSTFIYLIVCQAVKRVKKWIPT